MGVVNTGPYDYGVMGRRKTTARIPHVTMPEHAGELEFQQHGQGLKTRLPQNTPTPLPGRSSR